MKIKDYLSIGIFILLLMMLLGPAPQSLAQPAPLDTIRIPLGAGSLTLPCYTPLAMSYYPYRNGVPNDTLAYILGEQLVAGSAATADRIIDVTSNGSYAYRASDGTWTGTLYKMQNGRAFLVLNRHEARTVALVGMPFDTATYLMPMPNGTIRCTGPRMLCDHVLDSVGLTTSGFHWSETMRRGGDLIIDLTTRQLARRDSVDGWIGTMTQLRVGQPVMIQVNHPYTFDWTYNPNRE